MHFEIIILVTNQPLVRLTTTRVVPFLELLSGHQKLPKFLKNVELNMMADVFVPHMVLKFTVA